MTSVMQNRFEPVQMTASVGGVDGWCSKLCSNRVGKRRIGTRGTGSVSEDFRQEIVSFGQFRKGLIEPWQV
jgi:hypothetical protein